MALCCEGIGRLVKYCQNDGRQRFDAGGSTHLVRYHEDLLSGFKQRQDLSDEVVAGRPVNPAGSKV